jgi:hypothetical protein
VRKNFPFGVSSEKLKPHEPKVFSKYQNYFPFFLLEGIDKVERSRYIGKAPEGERHESVVLRVPEPRKWNSLEARIAYIPLIVK